MFSPYFGQEKQHAAAKRNRVERQVMVLHKQVKLITVVIMAITMIVCALLVMDRLDGNIQVMQGKVKNAELELRQVQQKQGEITTEIANMDKESYIIARARELDYLMPGEMRFVVVNPEVLTDDPAGVQVEEWQNP